MENLNGCTDDRAHLQPKPCCPSQPKTRDRSLTCLTTRALTQPQPAHTTASVAPHVSVWRKHPLGSSGLIGSVAAPRLWQLIQLEKPIFRPVRHRSDPLGLDFNPV